MIDFDLKFVGTVSDAELKRLLKKENQEELKHKMKEFVRGENMGCVSTITAYGFPKQSEYVNRRCKVCFHYDTSKWIMGTVIRDDREEPNETLIKLDDGRILRGVECQYSFSLDLT